MFESLIDRLAKEWAVVSQVPVSFAVAVCVVATFVWVALRWQYSARLAHRDDEIAAYRRKLDGATPDEARANIAHLQDEVRALRALLPWTLSEDQVKSISSALNDKPTGIKIIRYIGSSGLENLQGQLVSIFGSHKWAVQHWATMGTPIEPHETFTLCVPRDANRNGVEQVRSALKAAGIKFGEQPAEIDEKVPTIWLSSACS